LDDASSKPPLLVYLVVQVFYSCLHATWSGPSPATIAEQFPTKYRSRLAIGYSVANVLGGFTPFIATWLISYLGTPAAPAFYVMLAAVIAFPVVLKLKETAGSELR
jgi:MFS transporter, MHS family, proline/betaine transporter